ncbi:MAG TPA: response regulator transcription factor [Candidatus Eisenbacteria bacterium]|nr:response regulator transcription factor [Candidatus Eisenbacteria bacterium]
MRVLLVEDDAALVKALVDGLATASFAVDHARTAERALELMGLAPYDLLILDLGLPGMAGLALTRKLRERQDTIPILMLTARATVPDRVAGLDAGADDYLTKPFALSELLARVRALLRRGTVVSGTVLRVGDLELDPARFEVRRGDTVVSLTAKEFAILEYLMRHSGELVTRSALLESCWDESYEGISNLVDVHVSRVRRKLDVSGRPPLLHTIRGAGFILGERAG